MSAAGLELALLHQYLGRRDEAAAQQRVLVDRLQRSPDAVDLYRAARVARTLGRYRQANALLRNAAGAAPDDPAIETLWGDLLGEKYDQAEASQFYLDHPFDLGLEVAAGAGWIYGSEGAASADLGSCSPAGCRVSPGNTRA